MQLYLKLVLISFYLIKLINTNLFFTLIRRQKPMSLLLLLFEKLVLFSLNDDMLNNRLFY